MLSYGCFCSYGVMCSCAIGVTAVASNVVLFAVALLLVLTVVLI